eukprot:52701-Eustigmatos_ZCMA.PRE.1
MSCETSVPSESFLWSRRWCSCPSGECICLRVRYIDQSMFTELMLYVLLQARSGHHGSRIRGVHQLLHGLQQGRCSKRHSGEACLFA